MSTRPQKRLANRVEERVANYLCAWRKERFRPRFRAGEGGAHNLEKYCQTLGDHPAAQQPGPGTPGLCRDSRAGCCHVRSE